MDNNKYLCFQCAQLLRDAGYKVNDVSALQAKSVKCDNCGKKRYAGGVLVGENRK